MRKWLIYGIAIALPILAIIYFWFRQGDVVALTNTSGNENGILVNAQGSSGVLSDQTFKSTANTISVGRLTAATGRNEVIAFTNSRPVAITPAAWTPFRDTINLPFAAEIKIPITVWVVKGPFADQSSAAKSRCVDVAAMWQSERMGVAFADPGGCNVEDKTSINIRKQFTPTDCDSQPNYLQQAIPPIPGRINMYVVDTVQLSNGSIGTGNGTSCGTSDFVALGSTADAGVAIHELGHNFSLTHIDWYPSTFDANNIMYSASNTRAYFTEGQLFRAHFTPAGPSKYQPGSALNSVYTGARAGQPTRDCATDPSLCPKLEKRIWDDGNGACCKAN